MDWSLSHRCHPDARAIADRHYNRQNIGAVGFMPPGRCLVLLSNNGKAVWGTSYPFAQYVRHKWKGWLVNSLFRNEGGGLSSDLIRQAVACTLWKWPDNDAPGFLTFVDEDKVKPKRDPGWCYIKAGWHYGERSKGGKISLELFREDWPEPQPPNGGQLRLQVAA